MARHCTIVSRWVILVVGLFSQDWCRRANQNHLQGSTICFDVSKSRIADFPSELGCLLREEPRATTWTEGAQNSISEVNTQMHHNGGWTMYSLKEIDGLFRWLEALSWWCCSAPKPRVHWGRLLFSFLRWCRRFWIVVLLFLSSQLCRFAGFVLFNE